MVVPAKKKLLVLDVNGLLLDTYFNSEKCPERPYDGKLNKHYVYRRPYCNEFVEFCFENFEVGVWSSAKQHNVDNFIDFIFGDLKSKLLFCWHQAECTDTGSKTPGNRWKPLFLKELSKLWNKVKPDLPWEEGDYGPFNTLLIDDSPYKALRNPPHTAVFPYPYKVSNNFDDSLGGALRKYLEGLAIASDVQDYVKHHPFGQPPLSILSPNWGFYRKIILRMGGQEASWAPRSQEYKLQSTSLDDREVGLQSGNGQHSGQEASWAPPSQEYKLQSTSLDDREVGLQSGNGQHSESALRNAKRRKKHGLHLASSTNEYSVPGMEEEENDMVDAAIPSIEKCMSSENREVGLQSGNGQHSESSLCIGKRKKRPRNRLVTSTNQSSVPGMEEEENGVVNAAMSNMEKSISLENREVGLQSGNGQQSGSSLLICKGKMRHRSRAARRLSTSTNESLVLGKEKEVNGVAEAAMPDMEKSEIITRDSLSQEHESCNLFRGYKDANLLSDHGEPPEVGLSQNSSFSNRKRRHEFHQDTSIPQESAPDMGYKEDRLVEAVDFSTAKGSGTTVASFRQKHEVYNMPCKDKVVTAQTGKDHCGNKPYTSGRKFRDQNSFRHVNKGHHYKPGHFSEDYQNSFRHVNKGHHYKPGHFSEDYHMNSNGRSSSHSQTNSYGGSQASYIPERQFQANCGHKNGVNDSIQTQVAQGGIYTSNKIYGKNAVHTNLPPYQSGGYDGQDRWHMWGGFQHPPPGQSYNQRHIGSTGFQSYNPNQGATEYQGPVIQSPLPNSVLHEQMHAPRYSTQYQGHGRNFQRWKSNSSSKRFRHR